MHQPPRHPLDDTQTAYTLALWRAVSGLLTMPPTGGAPVAIDVPAAEPAGFPWTLERHGQDLTFTARRQCDGVTLAELEFASSDGIEDAAAKMLTHDRENPIGLRLPMFEIAGGGPR